MPDQNLGSNRAPDGPRSPRQARRRKRDTADPPTSDPSFDGFALADLRRLRDRLSHEETQVSYWRRIVQGRLEVVGSHEPEPPRVAELGEIMAGAERAITRGAFVDVEAIDDDPPLPELAEIWARRTDPSDTKARQALLDDLNTAEARLSSYRRHIHELLDGVVDELVARYHDQPLLALQILPDTEDRREGRGYRPDDV